MDKILVVLTSRYKQCFQENRKAITGSKTCALTFPTKATGTEHPAATLSAGKDRIKPAICTHQASENPS